jgi:hypothetical protein
MDLKKGDKVDLTICEETNLGFNAIINNEFEGLLYHNEIFINLEWDMKITGYIKKIRSDGKIDVSLQQQGFLNIIDNNCRQILERLKITGVLDFSDKSSPEDIMNEFQMSKKAFKKALGVLYKDKWITIEPYRILLIK